MIYIVGFCFLRSRDAVLCNMKNTATNHTRIAFALGLEHELLKPKDIQLIPPATRSNWRLQKPEPERYEVVGVVWRAAEPLCI